jgi:hypothetical protein
LQCEYKVIDKEVDQINLAESALMSKTLEKGWNKNFNSDEPF